MKKTTVFEVFYDENGKPTIGTPEGLDNAVVAFTDAIRLQLALGSKDGLNLLFATTIHLLAGTPNEKFLEDYIKNLRNSYKEYHEAYMGAMKSNKMS